MDITEELLGTIGWLAPYSRPVLTKLTRNMSSSQLDQPLRMRNLKLPTKMQGQQAEG